jgi:ketosteroid isomerase-like protein
MQQSIEQQVQWLVDRALISDLLHSFARALDTKDFAAYVDNYTEDGTIELPQPSSTTGGKLLMRRDEMLAKVPHSLAKYSATHHLSSNHQITINGDTASSRSYLQAVHVGATPLDHWDGGGWYDSSYRRTAAGWKFVTVKLTVVWLSGTPTRFTTDAP